LAGSSKAHINQLCPSLDGGRAAEAVNVARKATASHRFDLIEPTPGMLLNHTADEFLGSALLKAGRSREATQVLRLAAAERRVAGDNSATRCLHGLKWAASAFRFVIVGECILFPFTVAQISVEADVGMNGHAVVCQHPFVNAFADVRSDWL
jgi:hypothetical protein